jgi:hypothetical protein
MPLMIVSKTSPRRFSGISLGGTKIFTETVARSAVSTQVTKISLG